MPTLRITKRTIEALPFAPTGQMLYRDTELTGFGVRIGTRSKVYFVESQVRCRTVRTSIGRADVFSPRPLARRRCWCLAPWRKADIQVTIETQPSPSASRSIRPLSSSLQPNPHLSPRTVHDYGRTRDIYLRDWKGRALSAIDREMILLRHRAITDDHGAVTANNVMRHLRSVYNFTLARYEALPPNPVLILSKTRSWHREQRRRGLIAPHQFPAWWKAVMGRAGRWS